MAELRSKYVAADIVVFATPLYVDNVTGMMKNFMDRLVTLADPYFEKDENGQYRHVKGSEKVQRSPSSPTAASRSRSISRSCACSSGGSPGTFTRK